MALLWIIIRIRTYLVDPYSQDRAYLDAVVDGVLLVAEGEEAVPALEIKLPAQLKKSKKNIFKQ